MLHLPALKMTEQIDKFLNAARSMNLAVRGLFGEGSEASGDFYQLSNQATLGVSENEVVQLFEKAIIPEIVEYETLARKEMLDKHSDLLDDKIARALALLKSAHLISSQEALFLLSHIRLGLNMRQHLGASTPAIDDLCNCFGQNLKENNASGRPKKSAKPISINTINRLFMLTLPAHLQINHGTPLDPQGRDVLRAKIIRQALNPKKH
jgi:protein arginine kinase